MIGTLYARKTYVWGCSFGPIRSDYWFSRHEVAENRKCTELPKLNLNT